MNLDTTGVAAAAATFGSVWFGHVAVRWLEFRVARLWIPQAAFASAGLALLAFSLSCRCEKPSIVAGIAGLVLVYDAFEFWRQSKRVGKARAVANPANPRHRAVVESGLALAEDLFAREPEPPRYSVEARR